MAITYQVVTHGLSGELTRAVSAQRLRQMHINDDIIDKLVDHSIVLKKGLNEAQAHVYQDRLSRAGLNVELRSEGKTKLSGGKLTAGFKAKAKSLGSLTHKLKQGVEAKLKNVNVPQLNPDNDENDGLIDDDDTSKTYKANQSQQDRPVKTSGHWRGPHDVDKLFHSEMPRVKMPVTLPVSALKGAILTLIIPGLYSLILLTFVWMLLGNTWSAIAGFSSLFTFIAQFVFANMFLLIIIGFMAKPILALTSRTPAVEISKYECPELFWLISSICSKLKVSPPEAICVDMSVDMRLTYINRFKGFFNNRTRLIIGAPLTQSLSTAEFVGILSHTLAHLQQPLGGRTHYIIRSVNAWLLISSKEDDLIDRFIDQELSKSEITVIVDILFTALQRLFATSKLLMGTILRTNIKLVGKDARALDIHADHFAAVMIGSDAFEQLALEYRKAIRAFEQSEAVNDQLMVKNQLLQDIPEVVGSLAKTYDNRVENALRQDIEHHLTYTWEPHPADWERIDKANFLQASAIFFCDQPLIELIPSIHQIGIKATKAFYQFQDINPSEYTLARPKF